MSDFLSLEIEDQQIPIRHDVAVLRRNRPITFAGLTTLIDDPRVQKVAVEDERPCFHVWAYVCGEIDEPGGIHWRCVFCPHEWTKRRGAFRSRRLSQRAERGADTPLVHPATAPAPRLTPSTAP